MALSPPEGKGNKKYSLKTKTKTKKNALLYFLTDTKGAHHTYI